MKYLLSILCVTIFCCVSNAQKIIAYKAVIQTQYGKSKGVFQTIDSTSIMLKVKNQFVSINLDEINSIKIRQVKKYYRIKKHLKNTNKEQIAYQMNTNGELFGRYENTVPQLGEDVAVSFWFAFINGVANAVAYPIYAINPNVAKFKVKDKIDSAQRTQIGYYSVAYQLKPDVSAELKQIREISEKAKHNFN